MQINLGRVVGKSAYEQAQAGGYTGTEAQFAADLADIVNHKNNKNNPHEVTAAQVGARPNTWTPTAEDVGARANTWLPTPAEIGAVSTDRNNQYNYTNMGLNGCNIDTDYTFNYVVGLSMEGYGTRPYSGWMQIVNTYTYHFATQFGFALDGAGGVNKLYFRSRYAPDGYAWSAWKELATMSDIIGAIEGGY